MIERYVIMKFKAEEKDNFLSIFESKKKLIASFEGCTFLELRHSKKNRNWLMTFSIWKNENFLELYRHSKIFEEVWSNVKPLFCEKAEALTIFPEVSSDLVKKQEFLSKFDS
jgi:(4S)-4-hydroxy-5-phosphonooxypentane-2,3-dione isomerase